MRSIRAGLVASLVVAGWTVAPPVGAASGRECQLERPRAVPPLGPAVGDGPIYTYLGPQGRAEYRPGDVEGGWYRRKIAWLAEPGSTGTVEIRGRRASTVRARSASAKARRR